MDTSQTTKNKETIRNLYENILNNGKLDQIGEIISEEYIGVRGEKGPVGFAQTVESLRIGFPDIKWTIEDLIAENDKVIVRWSWKGTNKGSFRGFPISNKAVDDNAIAIYQFSGQKVIRAWIQSDRLGFLIQIGIVSADVLTPPSNEKKEFSFLVRVPVSYSSQQAGAVNQKWILLLEQWKMAGIYITSFAFPGESHVLTGKDKLIKKEAVISDNLRVVSNIFLRAENIESALNLAKSFPILEYGGSVEVREIPPRPASTN
jgi:predicted ester cyclase